jgi:hypothetical protein
MPEKLVIVRGFIPEVRRRKYGTLVERHYISLHAPLIFSFPSFIDEVRYEGSRR